MKKTQSYSIYVEAFFNFQQRRIREKLVNGYLRERLQFTSERFVYASCQYAVLTMAGCGSIILFLMKDQKKSTFIQIRVSSKEKQELVIQAERSGMDLSEFMLNRALPRINNQFSKIISSLTRSGFSQIELAELNDLLFDASADEISSLPEPKLDRLSPDLANYVAAIIEHAAYRAGGIAPAWTALIMPPVVPYFGSSLISLRPYLLRVSPASFRRRNIFIDATVGDRV